MVIWEVFGMVILNVLRCNGIVFFWCRVWIFVGLFYGYGLVYYGCCFEEEEDGDYVKMWVEVGEV